MNEYESAVLDYRHQNPFINRASTRRQRLLRSALANCAHQLLLTRFPRGTARCAGIMRLLMRGPPDGATRQVEIIKPSFTVAAGIASQIAMQ
jgi:hypothetical protein